MHVFIHSTDARIRHVDMAGKKRDKDIHNSGFFQAILPPAERLGQAENRGFPPSYFINDKSLSGREPMNTGLILKTQYMTQYLHGVIDSFIQKCTSQLSV